MLNVLSTTTNLKLPKVYRTNSEVIILCVCIPYVKRVN